MTTSQTIEKIRAVEMFDAAHAAALTDDYAELAEIISYACDTHGVKFRVIAGVAYALKNA